jgi:trehalose 6-phosphate phosphatase
VSQPPEDGTDLLAAVARARGDQDRVLETLVAISREPGRALVVTDFDGTLAPIVPRPEDARPVPGAVTALRRIASVTGGVAVLTGRPAAVAADLLGLTADDAITVLGHYGLERWARGELFAPPPHPGLAAVREAVADLARRAGSGVVVEDKVRSLAVHTRQAPDPVRALDTVTPGLCRLAGSAGLEVVPGKFVLELRPPGTDKGSALARLIVDVDPAAVLFAGDDLGDVPAARVVRDLRRSGRRGVVVAVEGPQLPEELNGFADLVVDGPVALGALLTALAAAASG